MSSGSYTKHHGEVATTWHKVSVHAMKKAVDQEAEYAQSINSIDEQGFPLVPVVVDGCWSKRSYQSNYSASSGVATIVGQHTGKVLYIGVRNKFCSICSKNDTNKTKPHACTKNFSGCSTSMEADILVQGFQSSIEMYGIKYHQMVHYSRESGMSKPFIKEILHKTESNCCQHLLSSQRKKMIRKKKLHMRRYRY